MAARRERRGARPGFAAAVLVAALSALVLTGCGETGDASGSTSGGAGMVIDQTGSIEAGDTRDPNHANLAYDAFTFDATTGATVVVDATVEGFVPLLKLVEVATGAVLAEWDAAYPDDEALTYTIAGPGTYEARIYAQEDGSGAYTLRVRVDQ